MSHGNSHILKQRLYALIMGYLWQRKKGIIVKTANGNILITIAGHLMMYAKNHLTGYGTCAKEGI